MKKIKLTLFLIILILLISSNLVFGKYTDVIYGKATATLKKPIFSVEKIDEIHGQISSLTNNYYESEFNILNYIR